MTKKEFVDVIGYLEAATGKQIATGEDERRQRLLVYWDLLQDFPLEVLRAAAKRLAARLTTSKGWIGFPAAGDIRNEVFEMCMAGKPTAAEAWEMAKTASRKRPIQPLYHVQEWYTRDGDQWKKFESEWDAIIDGVLPAVAKTMRQIGLRSIREDNESVVRAHFMKAYEQQVEAVRQNALAGPADIKLLGGPVAQALKSIGVE